MMIENEIYLGDINKEKIKENVWDFAIAQNKNRGKHPAIFPIKLILDHIK